MKDLHGLVIKLRAAINAQNAGLTSRHAAAIAFGVRALARSHAAHVQVFQTIGAQALHIQQVFTSGSKSFGEAAKHLTLL